MVLAQQWNCASQETCYHLKWMDFFQKMRVVALKLLKLTLFASPHQLIYIIVLGSVVMLTFLNKLPVHSPLIDKSMLGSIMLHLAARPWCSGWIIVYIINIYSAILFPFIICFFQYNNILRLFPSIKDMNSAH